MKNLLRMIAFWAILFAGSAAQASSYALSYVFSSGDTVSATFEGTTHGDLVTNLHDILLSYNGVPIGVGGDSPFVTYTYSGSPWIGDGANAWTLGTGVVSFSGKANYIYFANFDPNYNWVSHKNPVRFFIDPNVVGLELNSGGDYVVDGEGTYSASRWSLIVTSVPEPETYGMLLGGLALTSLIARRRKSNKVG